MPNSRHTVTLAIVVLVLVAGAIAAKQMFSVKSPHGSPVGSSVRAGGHIATLIRTLEPYMATLHRNPGDDRYRVALFLQPVDGRSPGRMIPIRKGFRAEELRLARIFGHDGSVVWCDANGLVGVDPQTGKILGAEDLRRANPSLDEAWDDPRRIAFDGRLRVTAPDRKRILAVEPGTLKALPVEVEGISERRPFDPEPIDFLAPGARPSPTQWLGLHSTREAEVAFKPPSWLRPLNRAEDAKEMRRFYRGHLGPELDRSIRQILSMTPLSDDAYLNGSFVRAARDADPALLSGPEGFLIVYTSEPGLKGRLMVSRVDTAGKPVWKADTGIDRLQLRQILPDARFVAFIGPRPPVPDKVSEPVLAIIDTQSGAVSMVSLWQ